LFPLGSFGHTGFTGTSIWIDPASDSFVIFLSNRVHPDGKGDVASLRGRVASIVASSITDASVSKAREESANAAAEMLTSLARLNSITARAASSAVPAPDAQVLTHRRARTRRLLKQLAGAHRSGDEPRVAIGRQADHRCSLQSTNVKLVALFALTAASAGSLTKKSQTPKDEQTGLPIYSLYGETRRPKPEQLKDLDALVYDIQDVGVRFYTYISTLGIVIEEAGKAKMPIFVLDRPNPINGIDVEGPIADADKLSFVAYHTIPVRHGMTVGELARLYNEDRHLTPTCA
jgi:hypothetical protein